MEKFLFLSESFMVKTENPISINGLYLNSNFSIIVNNTSSKSDYTFDPSISDILKDVKVNTNNIISNIKIGEDPLVFKNSIRKIIKNETGINKIIKILKKNEHFKYVSELDTIVFLYFVNNDEFLYLHEEYLMNIKRFIEKKYFKDINIIDLNDDDKIKILNKIIFNTFKGRRFDSFEDFVEYIKLEIRIYLRLRNSYNVRIKEIRRKSEYEKSNVFNYITNYNSKKLYEPASLMTNDNCDNLANNIIKFLKDKNLVPTDATIDEITDKYLNCDLINKIKEEYKWVI